MSDRQFKRGSLVSKSQSNSTQGSEQAGTRPVIVFQNEIVSQFSTAISAIPLTTNLRRASLPICIAIAQGNGRLAMRLLDKTRLIQKLGQLNTETIAQLGLNL